MNMACRSLLLALAAIAVLGACDSGGRSSGSASCASAIKYDRSDYVGHSADVAPEDHGRELGGARIPACNDTGGPAGGGGEEIVVVELKGVPPAVAVGVTYSDKVIFIRAEYPLDSLPAAVKRLLPR